MPLANYTPAKRRVPYGDGEDDYLELRALTLQDVAILIDSHRFAMDQIATTVRTAYDSATLTEADVISEIIMDVVRESPLLAANVLALCADEPDHQARALNLPLPIVAEALQVIAGLTFTDEAAVKKFLANVRRLIIGMTRPTTVGALAAE
jgi:hypothetical protein